jgi:HK97 family phage major capsid protein
MSSYIETLRNEYNQTHIEAGNVISTAAKEARTLTALEKEANDKRYSRMDEIKSTLDDNMRFAKSALDSGIVALPKQPPGREEYESNLNFSQSDGSLNLAAIRKGINHFARTGETRQLYTVTTATGSGAYLPTEVLQPISVRRLQNSFRGLLAAYGVEPLRVPTPATFKLPVGDDTANFGVVQAEGASAGTQLDPADASVSIAPTLWTSKQFWYSNTMVLANQFDLLGYVLPMAQKRIDKIQESTWTTLVKAQANGATTTANTGITYIDLLNWEHSLAAAYRVDAGFIVSDAAYRALRGLVDTNNRPILDLDPTNVFVGKIHGKPVIVNDYLNGFGVAQKLGFFGSADAFKIVDVMDARVIRYKEVPAQPDQIGFEQFQNGDMAFVSKGVSVLGT